MIEIIFFSMEDNIANVAGIIFTSLGIQSNSFRSGESSHALQGIYYDYSCFGIKIKLEYNSYDYEDKYNYMLSVRQDLTVDCKSDDEMVKQFATMIIKLLTAKFNIEIAYEIGNGQLSIYTKKQI